MPPSRIDVFCDTDATNAKGGLNLAEIKEEMKKVKLSTTGTRAELRARLCKYRAQGAQGSSQTAQGSSQKAQGSQKAQTAQFVESGAIDRLLQLLDGDNLEEEFDILSAKWFKSLPMERHRDTTWTDKKIGIIYKIAFNDMKKTPSGRAFLHKIETGKEVSRAVEVSAADIKKSLKYDSKRKILFLEGKVLASMAGFVGMTYEHAGMIDLKKSGLFDRAIFGIGAKEYIIPTDLLDFEVTFHTHPIRPAFQGIIYDIPSEFDTRNMLPANKPKFQVHIVFTMEAVYTLYSDPRKVSNLTTDEFFKAANVYASKALKGTKQDLDNYIAFLKTHGIYMFRHSTNLGSKNILWNWPEQIPLYINPVEPIITLTTRIASRVHSPND
jgi:hypothetical protein